MIDIIILERNGNSVVLFANSFVNGNNNIYYRNSIEPKQINAVELETSELVLENLEIATYYFSSSEDMKEEISIPIVSDEKAELEKTFFDYLECDDEEEKNNFVEKIDRIIKNIELCMNYYEDGIDIRITKTNRIELDILSAELLRDGILMIAIEKYDAEKMRWSTYDIFSVYSAHIPMLLEDDELYRISILKNGTLIRRHTVLAEQGYSDKNYELIIENKKQYQAAAEESSYFLPSSYEYGSEKEKQIMLCLNYFEKTPTIMHRPRLGLENNTVRLQLDESCRYYKIKQLYLCGIEEDQVYIPSAAPRLIPITSDDMKFDIREYNFNREPYYFFIADENGKRISSTTYLDLSMSITDNENYNLIYQYIYESQYVINLARTFDFFMLSAWNKLKQMLDSYLAKPDIEYMDITDYLISRVCLELSPKEYNIQLVIFYLEFCRQKYYLDKNIGFAPRQKYERLTKTHFVEKGNYICRLMQISPGGEITYSYFDGRESGVYFRTDKAQYTLFRCISLEDYSVNDYNLYYLNSDRNVEYKYIDKSIEVDNG